jgi:NhaP-type Na+/H+ or K+/H+ antiporter
MANMILGAGLFVFVAHILDAVFRRTRIPDILILMILGVLAGSVFKWVDYTEYPGLWKIMAAVTLVVILFESGLSLPLKPLLKAAGRAVPFALISFVMTVTVLSLVAGLLLGLRGWTAILAGFILGGTSSAVVIPIVGALKTSQKTATILTLESAITDVLCIIGTFGIASGIAEGQGVETRGLMEGALFSFIVALLFGIACGLVWSIVLGFMRKLDSAMFTTLAFALIVYGVAELLGISGAIASLSLGITMGNISGKEPDPDAHDRTRKKKFLRFVALSGAERVVYQEVVFLLKAFFFFFLGLTVELGDFVSWNGICALVLACVVLVPRYPAIRYLFPKKTSNREALLAWAMVPRGLAAVVLATVPSQYGIEGANDLAQTVTMTVFLNITLVAVLVFLVERGWLDGVGAKFLPGFSAPAPAMAGVTDVADVASADVPSDADAAASEAETNEAKDPEPEAETNEAKDPEPEASPEESDGGET